MSHSNTQTEISRSGNQRPADLRLFFGIEEPIVLFRSADLLINLNTRQVWREGVELSIKREGFSLLRRLVLDYRLTKSREELMMITKRGAMDNALSHCVSRLRKALGTYRGQALY